MNNSAKIALVTGGSRGLDARPSKRWHSAA